MVTIGNNILNFCSEPKVLGPAVPRGIVLPWGAQKERSIHSGSIMELDIRPGEFVMRNLFADFTVLAEKKIELVLSEPQVWFDDNF